MTTTLIGYRCVTPTIDFVLFLRKINYTLGKQTTAEMKGNFVFYEFENNLR